MYNLIQQNKDITLQNLPKGKNMTNFSILNELSEKLTFRAFSIKYVVEGTEKYEVNGTKYQIKTNEYLLANTFCEGRVEVESKELVKGICIDISPEFLAEVFSHFIRPDALIPDIQLDTFFNTEEFFENKYHAHHTQLGKSLAEISNVLSANPFEAYQLNNDFYFTLAEHIVADHAQMIGELYNINTVKQKTRKELYRKLLKGKSYLEERLQENIHILDIAQEAGLSEYHFFRLFKTSFGITPQQYLIQIRLTKAWQLLKSGHYNITEVAHLVGFADIYSFSKAFKKRFKISPTERMCV
jgi:AraC family transcriptional regulator